MKTSLVYDFRLVVFAMTFAFSTVNASAAHTHSPDRAAELLARFGTIRVNAAGPYVEIGTFRIQVMTKLGAPSAKLPDGRWLYEGRSIEGSEAQGTLVIYFVKDRVGSMSLVTPAVATAMMKATATFTSKAVRAQQPDVTNIR